MLFEIRIHAGVDGKPAQWCLDSFATAGGQSRALLNCDKMHPFGAWYRVTAVYDGKMLHNYVGDELQGEGPLTIPAERPGRASAGTRIDLRDYYKGAIYEAASPPAPCPPPTSSKSRQGSSAVTIARQATPEPYAAGSR